jgi:hypothetical protein
MPFDGTDYNPPTPFDARLFPIWSRQAWRLLLRMRLRPRSRGLRPELRALPDRATAVQAVLRDAQALIEDPRNWTRGAYRSFLGRRCAVGALRAVARRHFDPGLGSLAHGILIEVAKLRGFGSVEEMNDRSTHAEVLGAFSQAIARAATL